MKTIKDIIREEIEDIGSQQSQQEPQADYSDMLSRLKLLTPAFYNSIVRQEKANFNTHLKDVEGDIGWARERQATNFLYAIANKLGLSPIQYDWKNQDNNTPENPLTYFQIDFWANTKNGDPVNFRAYITVDENNTLNPYLSEIKTEDENFDDIAIILSRNYDAHRANQETLSAKKYEKFSKKDNMFWWKFFGDFNSQINKILDKYENIGTDEKSAKTLIAGAFLIYVAKLMKINPLPKLRDVKARHSYWSNYEAEINFPDGGILRGYIYIGGETGKYEVYLTETHVDILENGWHEIIPKFGEK